MQELLLELWGKLFEELSIVDFLFDIELVVDIDDVKELIQDIPTQLCGAILLIMDCHIVFDALLFFI